MRSTAPTILTGATIWRASASTVKQGRANRLKPKEVVLVEIIPLTLNAQGLHVLVPWALNGAGQEHQTFWCERWPSGEHPGQTIQRHLARRLEVEPLILHSTSWRTMNAAGREAAIILTYLTILPSAVLPNPTFTALPVTEHLHGLARGGSTTPPPEIHVWQVAQHALEHLHWLSHSDEAVRRRLTNKWLDHLTRYAMSGFSGY